MAKRRLIRVYADTSVFGGVLDQEFARASKLFFRRVREGRLTLVSSVLVDRELAPAPLRIRRFHSAIIRLATRIPISDAALELREAYVSAGIVGPTSVADALHVALATVAECSVLVSWNCKHIVNFVKIPRYNAVNRLQGYGEVAIHTPLEVIGDENDAKEV